MRSDSVCPARRCEVCCMALWRYGIDLMLACRRACKRRDKRQVFWNWMKLIIIDKSAHLHIISTPQSNKKNQRGIPSASIETASLCACSWQCVMARATRQDYVNNYEVMQ